MTTSLLATLERGTLRVDYSTVDFESAVRGLLVEPLLQAGISPGRVDEVVEAVLRREETGSTCSGPFALPHARFSGIPDIVAGLGVNPRGVYGENRPRVMLAFVSPMEAAGDHLRFLSTAAKAFRDPSFVERILGATSREDLLALLRATAG